jgi:hypothetical protein
MRRFEWLLSVLKEQRRKLNWLRVLLLLVVLLAVLLRPEWVQAQVIETDAQEAVALVTESEVKVKRTRAKGAGLPKKYAKMGFKKGWAAYNKTPKRKAAKKRATKKRGKR